MIARLCRPGFGAVLLRLGRMHHPPTQTPVQWYLAQLGGTDASFPCDILLGRKIFVTHRFGVGRNCQSVLLYFILGFCHWHAVQL